MSQLPIQIDATQLFYRYFIIPGVTSGWIDSGVVQNLQNGRSIPFLQA